MTPEQKELAAKALMAAYWESGVSLTTDMDVLNFFQDLLAKVGLAIQHVDASLPTVEQIQDIYEITKLRAALTEILEADKRGELHRDPLDTDEIFNQAKALMSM